MFYYTCDNGSFLFLLGQRRFSITVQTTAVFIPLQLTVVFYFSTQNGLFLYFSTKRAFIYNSSPDNSWFYLLSINPYLYFSPNNNHFIRCLQKTTVCYSLQPSSVFYYSSAVFYFLRERTAVYPFTEIWDINSADSILMYFLILSIMCNISYVTPCRKIKRCTTLFCLLISPFF